MAINDYDDLILGAANQYKVDPQLLKATMQVESGGNLNDPKTGKILTSSAGAQGLMQFIPSTAKQYGVNVNDPRSSIYGAAHYISDLLSQYGNPDVALDHYSGNTPGYGQKIVSAYKQVAAPVPGSSRPAPAPPGPSAAGSVPTVLPPGLQAIKEGKAPDSGSPPPTSGAPTATPAPVPLPPGLQQVRQTPDTSPPTSTTSTQPVQGDRLTAFGTGGRQGIATVLNSPSAWFGWNPLVSPNLYGNKLTPEEQASLEQYPTTSEIGRVAGGVAATAPLMVPATMFAPEIGLGGSLLGLGARGVIGGALAGGTQGAFSAGEQFRPGAPQEDLGTRIRKGAEWGAALGPVAGSAEWLGGFGEKVAPEVQQAGREMQNAGVGVTAANLQSGATATAAQAKQVNRAFGNIIGENTPDFTPDTLKRVIPKLGNDVGNAVRAGHIDVDAPLASGHSFQDELADIEKSVAGTSVSSRVQRLLNDITAKVGPGNRISGDDVADILQHNGQLDRAIKNPALSDAATRIDNAVHEAFTASSPPGVGDAYSLARERYKLGLVAEKAADKVTGNIDPKALLSTMSNMYKDFKTLGTGISLTDQAVNFSRNASRMFSGPAAPDPLRGYVIPGALSGVGTLAAHYVPAVADNPLLAAGAVVGPLAARWAYGAARRSGALGRNMLMRGQQNLSPYAAALSGQTAGAAGQ